MKMKMLVMDVSRAHFHPPAVRELYIDLPSEDGGQGMVGKLFRTLYRTRDAANQWDAFFNERRSLRWATTWACQALASTATATGCLSGGDTATISSSSARRTT